MNKVQRADELIRDRAILRTKIPSIQATVVGPDRLDEL